MKKLFLGVMALLSLVLMPFNVLADDKVTVYLFRGNECPHCEEALEYINEHKDEINKNIEIVTYEVWENQNNSKLQDEVATKLGIDVEAENYGVPLIVIGEKYVEGYSGVSSYNEIMSIAENYVGEKEYKDIVKETANKMSKDNKDMKFDAKGLSDIFSEPNKVVTIVVYSIFGLIVVGFIAMMVFSRK